MSTPARLAFATALLVGCAGNLRDTAQLSPTLATHELVEVADLLASRGEHLRAEQYYQEALKSGADARRVLPRLLALYVHDGQYRLAVELAENELRRHPAHSELRLLLATLYGALGQQARAIEHYRRVVAEAPDDAAAHFALASALSSDGRAPGDADAHYRAYLTLEPSGPHAEEARAGLLTELP